MAEANKAALITDASHPAAEAIALKLEKEGIVVIKNYPYMPSKADKDFSFDTSSLQEMKNLIDAIVAAKYNLNFLIHTDNAIMRSNIEDISEQLFKEVMDYNAKSAFITSKVFGEYIAQNSGGSIVYLSTIHDEKPTGCAFAYSVAKGAVKMLCKELALFYGRKGIRVNLVEADYMLEQKKLLDSFLSPFNYDAETKIPLRRLVTAEDIAGVVSFLISEEAAFVNGETIRVDGGHLLYYGDR